jgi:hypothetical protein
VRVDSEGRADMVGAISGGNGVRRSSPWSRRAAPGAFARARRPAPGPLTRPQ